MPAAQIDLTASRTHDLVVQRRMHGLLPNRRYSYDFSAPFRRSRIVSAGEFRTAPLPADPQTIRFAVTGDADGTIDPKTGKPAFNVFQVYGRMAAERNHFNINLGDTIYSDSEVGGVPPALTVRAKWAKYRRNLSFGHLRNLRRTAGLYSHWDDHEFINDFTRAEHGGAIFAAGATAFRDYAPVFVHEPRRALPDVPLGPPSRALLPRRALVPVREGEDRLRERPCADGTAAGAQRVRGARSRARQPRCPRLPRGEPTIPPGRCSALVSTRRSHARSARRRRPGR